MNYDRIELKVRQLMRREHEAKVAWIKSKMTDFGAFEAALVYHDKVNRLLRKLGEAAI